MKTFESKASITRPFLLFQLYKTSKYKNSVMRRSDPIIYLAYHIKEITTQFLLNIISISTRPYPTPLKAQGNELCSYPTPHTRYPILWDVGLTLLSLLVIHSRHLAFTISNRRSRNKLKAYNQYSLHSSSSFYSSSFSFYSSYLSTFF